MPSKKYKLPKKYWVKGKSKFLLCRLEEEKKAKIEELKMQKAKITEPIIIKKQTLWQKLKALLSILLRKMKGEKTSGRRG